MQISEKLDIIIEKHPYYKSLNKKLLEDESIADYNGLSQKFDDTALFSSLTTTSKSIDLITSWIQCLINKRYPYMSAFRLKKVHSWFVRYRVGDETKPHDHQPCLYSWVYFVNCPKGSSPLVFSNSGKRIKPEEGKVVIFPAILKHHVPKSRCDDRVVLSGNLTTLESDHCPQ